MSCFSGCVPEFFYPSHLCFRVFFCVDEVLLADYFGWAGRKSLFINPVIRETPRKESTTPKLFSTNRHVMYHCNFSHLKLGLENYDLRKYF